MTERKRIGVPPCPGIRPELLNDPTWSAHIGDYLGIYDAESNVGAVATSLAAWSEG